jgi:uncharacterized protein YkwD
MRQRGHVKSGASGGDEMTTANTVSDWSAITRSRLVKTAVVAVLALLPLASSAPGATASSRAQAAARRSTTVAPNFEARLATSINAVRERYGLRCLRLVPGLTRSADRHSLQMARRGYFSHYSLNGTSFNARVQSFYRSGGYSYWSAGENLLWARRSIKPNRVVARWLASPEHRSVLLSPQWTVMGVGVVQSRHGLGVFRGRAVLVITVDFAVRR